MRTFLCFLSLGFLASASCLAQENNKPVEHISKLSVKRNGIPVTLEGTESIRTQATFKPPVE